MPGESKGRAKREGWWRTRGSRGLLAAIGLALLGSCASLDSDWHLAPLVTQMNRHDGGLTREVLGGMVLAEDPPAGYKGDNERIGRRVRALRPIFSDIDHVNGDRTLEWLPPLGRTLWRGEEVTSYFFPIYTARLTPPDSKGRTFSMLVLPGFFWTRQEDGTDHLAWLPLYGDLRDFLTFSRIQFALFPLYLRTERAGNRTDNLLFPIFSWTRPIEDDGTRDEITDIEARPIRGWRVWPIVGHIQREESYDRRFFLWPVFQLQTNDLSRGEEGEQRIWSVFPLFTSTRMGSYKGYTFLWPFFGWGTDPRGDFWALDAPWPLVRFQRGGENTGGVVRSRIWPFYSHLKADKAESWSVAWPFVQWRHEDYRGYDRDSLYLLPFWRQWTSYVDEGPAQGKRIASWKKLWPLWSQEYDGSRRTTTILPLDPLWQSDYIEFHWGWLYQLYRETDDGPVRRERAWMGLWWRERNACEDRRSFTGLWSRRKVSREAESFTETSLLFGLLRWRSSSEGTRILPPALPGPGWPALERPAPPKPPPTVFPVAAP